MSHRLAWTPLILPALLLFGCALDKFTPPAVSPSLIASGRPDHATPAMLSRGRAIFVSRCLECHTLPSVSEHAPDEWPYLVSRMAARANLTTSDQHAITAYLRAASSGKTASRPTYSD